MPDFAITTVIIIIDEQGRPPLPRKGWSGGTKEFEGKERLEKETFHIALSSG